MKLDNRELVEDERAVSPVIGVILMVAITVILAAVIGTFVLDLGQSAGQSAPQASFQVSTSPSTNNVTIEHTGGDAVDAKNTKVIFEHQNGTTATFDPASSSSTLTVGGSVEFDTNVAPGNINVTSPWSGMTGSGGFGFNTGEQVTITIIDTQSQRQIFETTVTA